MKIVHTGKDGSITVKDGDKAICLTPGSDISDLPLDLQKKIEKTWTKEVKEKYQADLDLFESQEEKLELFVPGPPKNLTDGGVIGQTAFDNTYLYMCVAPNTWKRVKWDK